MVEEIGDNHLDVMKKYVVKRNRRCAECGKVIEVTTLKEDIFDVEPQALMPRIRDTHLEYSLEICLIVVTPPETLKSQLQNLRKMY